MFHAECAENSAGGGIIIALDPQTGEIHGPWQLCETAGSIDVHHRKVWVTCRFGVTDFGVLQGIEDAFLYTYENIGDNANPPLVINDQIWYTFEDSNTAAVFDLRTGELLRTWRLQAGPGAPIWHDGGVWVYHHLDDIWQRLTLDG